MSQIVVNMGASLLEIVLACANSSISARTKDAHQLKAEEQVDAEHPKHFVGQALCFANSGISARTENIISGRKIKNGH